MPLQDLLFADQETSLAELFHENTKNWPDVPSVPPELSGARLQHAVAHAFKVYNTLPKVELPREFHIEDTPLSDVIRHRRSQRNFTGESLGKEHLAALLALSVGITGEYCDAMATYTLRVFPSAGALYPLEVYPLILNVSGIEPGVYHYDVRQHALELLHSGDIRDIVFENCMRQDFVHQASLVLAMTAVFQRSKARYGERGYRFALLEAGHAAQNMYLVATALGLGVVSIGDFLDDPINDLLEIDGVAESVIYLVVFGALPPGSQAGQGGKAQATRLPTIQ
jgi:SagB-type dehydrogenase family enzyme